MTQSKTVPSKKSAVQTKRRADQKRRTEKNLGKLMQFIEFGLETGQPVRVVGMPGVGKTSLVLAACRDKGYEVVYFSLATLSAEDLAVVAPTNSVRELLQEDGTYEATSVMELETLLFDVLSNEKPKVIVLDEFSRCDKRTMASVMSLINEGAINGKEIPNLKGIFALDNPDNGDFMVSGADWAQSTRFGAHIMVTANDIPWREHLTKKFEGAFGADTLEKVWSTWENFSQPVRETVSPRVLEWMLSNAQYGVPIEWALGVDGLKTYSIKDEADVDVTKDVIASLGAAMGAPAVGAMIYPAVNAVESAIARAKAGIKANVRLVGHAGFAKTAWVMARLTEEYGEDGIVPFSLSTTSPENWGVPVPGMVEDEDGQMVRQLMFLLHTRFNDDVPKVLLLDEFSRAGKRTLNAVMEIVQEGTLNGHRIRGLQFVVALDNPTGKKGELGGDVVYATERLDRAQATRFAMTVGLEPQDIPWSDWLRAKYPESSKIFLDWWGSGLDEVGRIQANARILEKMILLYEKGLDIENALPIGAGNNRIGPDLHNLLSKLKGNRVVTLLNIVEEVDEYCEVFSQGESHPDYQERWSEAVNVFELIGDVATLNQHKDVIKRVSLLMGRQWKTSSVMAAKPNPPVLQWWAELWKVAWEEAKAAQDAEAKAS